MLIRVVRLGPNVVVKEHDNEWLEIIADEMQGGPPMLTDGLESSTIISFNPSEKDKLREFLNEPYTGGSGTLASRDFIASKQEGRY